MGPQHNHCWKNVPPKYKMTLDKAGDSMCTDIQHFRGQDLQTFMFVGPNMLTLFRIFLVLCLFTIHKLHMGQILGWSNE